MIVVATAATVVIVAIDGEDDYGGNQDRPEVIIGIGIAVHHKKASLNSGELLFPPFIAILCERTALCEINRSFGSPQSVQGPRKEWLWDQEFRC